MKPTSRPANRLLLHGTAFPGFKPIRETQERKVYHYVPSEAEKRSEAEVRFNMARWFLLRVHKPDEYINELNQIPKEYLYGFLADVLIVRDTERKWLDQLVAENKELTERNELVMGEIHRFIDAYNRLAAEKRLWDAIRRCQLSPHKEVTWRLVRWGLSRFGNSFNAVLARRHWADFLQEHPENS